VPKGWTFIPGGEFIMGSSRGEFDESPERRITLPPFLLSQTTVSNAQFEAIFPEHKELRDSISPGDQHPVIRVSWQEAAEYCIQMSKKEGLPLAIDTSGDWMDVNSTGWRLPTEAEWEFAARGGLIQMAFPWSDLPPGKDGVPRCNHGSGQGMSRVADGFYGTAPVRTFPPNAYGLYQMSGNVWEWCFDWYDTDTYLHEYSRFPLGPRTGKSKVIRGGAYDYSYVDCTVFHRDWAQPDKTFDNIGFRPARSLPREIVRWITTPGNEFDYPTVNP
jgi:formylglycine-generating enzyme required for sulfatase activity